MSDDVAEKPESGLDQSTSKTSRRKTNTVPSPVKKEVVESPSEIAVEADRKGRRTPLFPASSFEEALTIPNAIQKHAAGQTVRRLTLFDQLGKSPDSGPSRQLITNASKYGLIKGNYNAEHLELTPEGRTATSSEASPRDRLATRFRLAIERITPFKALYDSLKGNRVPASSVLEDTAKDKGSVPAEDSKECVELFVVNAKYLGILKPIAGAERIIPIEQALEELQKVGSGTAPVIATSTSSATSPTDEYQNTCFYISPIGEDGSEHRLHSDLFLGSLVEPALEEFKLKVVRADKIGKPGMIT